MPLRPVLCVCLALIGLAVPAGLLAAQDQFEVERKPLSLAIGGTIGSAGIACSPKCAADRQTGPLYLVRGTGQLSSQFAVSLEVASFRQGIATPNGQGQWTLSWYLLGAVWHPNEEEDFFINAAFGLGTGNADLTFPATGAWAMNFSQVGGVVGVGRDLRVTEKFALTPFVEYYMIKKTQALIGRANSGAKVAADVVVAGLALTLF